MLCTVFTFYINFITLLLLKSNSNQTINCKLYSAKMLKGHGIYLIGDSHEQRRHSWFSKSRVAPTVPEIRLGLGTGSTCCRGYSCITFNIGSDSACLIVLYLIYRAIFGIILAGNIKLHLVQTVGPRRQVGLIILTKIMYGPNYCSLMRHDIRTALRNYLGQEALPMLIKLTKHTSTNTLNLTSSLSSPVRT